MCEVQFSVTTCPRIIVSTFKQNERSFVKNTICKFNEYNYILYVLTNILIILSIGHNDIGYRQYPKPRISIGFLSFVPSLVITMECNDKIYRITQWYS